ncbi:MAG: site-specific DNA-methyltransferase [Sedimentisphaerales bacterium]|nr:site-specific DNA-methyltransferase [Sedimentisphaerales bacterium]
MDEIVLGDCLDLFPNISSDSVRTIHTSPPYNIERDYEGYKDNLPRKEYLDFVGEVLGECMRVLVPGGGLFWQTGYTSEGKDYIMPLDHLTFDVFRELGFRLKDRIIWRYWGGMAFKSKFTNKHETILWWVKPGQGKEISFFDVFPVREATKFHDSRNNLFGRNPGNVWEVDRVAYGSSDQTSHIAVFPEEISDRIILATTQEDDLVLDPFSGSGTVCKTAKARGRHFIGFEISPVYFHESVCRLGEQAQGELLAVLSQILKEHVFDVGETLRLSTIAEKANSILSPLSLEPYAEMFSEGYFHALCAGREDVVKKSDKMTLWRCLDKLLPPVGCQEKRNDPFGLLSLVDNAYLHAYKLHAVYSSAMRFHRVAWWLESLSRTLKLNGKEGWLSLLESLSKSETATYCLENDTMTLLACENGAIHPASGRAHKKGMRKDAVPTLF